MSVPPSAALPPSIESAVDRPPVVLPPDLSPSPADPAVPAGLTSVRPAPGANRRSCAAFGPDRPAAAAGPPSSDSRAGLDRRGFLAACSAAGLGGTLLPGVLWGIAQQRPVTTATIAEAEAIAGLELTPAQREAILRGVGEGVDAFRELRTVDLPNAVLPALRFDPVLPGAEPRIDPRAFRYTRPAGLAAPADLEAAAFWPVTHLAELIRSRQVTSAALTRMYLDRLKRYGFQPLEAIVTLTEERALEQAARADAEIAAGRYRGPLHGIPWGAKDLLATRGYPTTWGASPYREQVIDEDATVVERLDAAGAVLVAKLTLGALAQGDVWFGGVTRNPWNLEQGSSGSSAGSAAAVVAGLVGFAIGSETLGSLVSPAARTGATTLRPTFGRVSRHGAMALSWSMDKLGPLCRSAEDCALVMHAVNGPDGRDPTVRDVPFNWRPDLPIRGLRVAHLASAFESDRPGRALDQAALAALRGLGIETVPFELPDDLPLEPLRIILRAESAAAFDELTRSGRVDEIENSARPTTFRQARFIPAVEYIQANRVRTLLMEAMERALRNVDVLVAPTFAPGLLLLTNLTGHPVAVVPSGFTAEGAPVSVSFVGNLWRDAEALAVAQAYQQATGFHERRPAGFGPAGGA
jgi:Asp-tRNA(Asn)/Glu-tRNA(Gln) amidotransferase A subunit family amidase